MNPRRIGDRLVWVVRSNDLTRWAIQAPIFHRHQNTFSVVISKNLWTKRNIIVTIQSGQITEQPKTLDDLDRFDLKFYLNCPIRIQIITGSHIFILFLPWVGTLIFILSLATTQGKIFVIKCQPVEKNNINICLQVIIS